MSDELDMTVHIEASPATVFAYLVEREQMLRWMGLDARLDPRPGGALWVDVNGRDAAGGEYVVVVPDERVVFTWGWDGSELIPTGSSTVEIDLRPEGHGTLLRLRHTGLPSAGDVEQHEHGWHHYLGRLGSVAGGVDPGADAWAQPA